MLVNPLALCLTPDDFTRQAEGSQKVAETICWLTLYLALCLTADRFTRQVEGFQKVSETMARILKAHSHSHECEWDYRIRSK